MAIKKDLLSDEIFELLDEGVIGVDRENKILFANSEAERFLNFSKEKVTGKKIGEVFSEIAGKTANEIDEIRGVKIRAVKLEGENGEITGTGLLIKKTNEADSFAKQIQEKLQEIEYKKQQLRDLKQILELEKQNTEQKVLDSTRNLREEHTRILSSINNLNMGFIMTDKDKNIILVNKTAKDIFNLPYIETNVGIDDLQAQVKERPDFIKSLDESLKDGKKSSFEAILIGKRFADIFFSPIIVMHDRVQEIIGCVILVEDKTDDRLMEKSKENFFVIASHELRTPLTGIRGYISIVKQFYFESIKNDELKRIIDDIDISSNRLINIVNEFLDTTKIEQDKITVKSEPCDLISIINSCIQETESIASEKKLSVKFDNDLTDAFVTGDPDRIKQIIINLISNGVKYTERGEVTLSVERTENGRYKVLVRDTGKGIPEENIKMLFSKYQQVDANKSKKIVSTGLGLYISKLLADKMNGEIKLEKTEVAKGSTFSLSFPMHK